MPLLFRGGNLNKEGEETHRNTTDYVYKTFKYLRYDNEKNPIKNPNSEPDDQERPETIGSICEIRSNSKEHYLNIYIDHEHNLNQPMEN